MNDERNSSDSERAKIDIEGRMEHVGNEDSECEKMIPEQVDTELSQEILYETMHKIIGRSAKRRKQRRTVKAIRKKNRKADGDYRDESDEVYVPRATSRCSIPYLFEIIKLVRQSERLTALVTKIGFQHILALDECYVPRAFAQWVADCTIPEEKVIKFEGNSIQLSVYSVVQTLGIPEGELPVETDEEIGKASFLAAFNLTDLPTIKYFGNKILYEKNISDEDFCRCFMIVCNGTFLCPNSNTKPSTTYLGALVDVDKIKDRNWAKFVHEWLILFIKKYLNKKKRVDNKYLTLGGCIHHLAVRCLDFLDFGSIKLPRTMPRIHVWKGDMIKHFSDMTMGKDGKYGARSIIVESRTCYAKVENENEHTSVQANPICNQAVEVTNASNSRIIELLDMFSEQSMSKKIKQDIVDVFKNIMKDEDVILQSKVATLVSNVVKLLVDNNRESGDTEKVNCSQEVQNSTSVRNESQNTLKLDSTESIDARSKQVSFTSKKRRALDEVSSQHSVMSEYVKKQKVDKISEETIVDNVVEQLNPIIEDFAKFKEVPTSLVT